MPTHARPAVKKMHRQARDIFDHALNAADAGSAVRNHLHVGDGKIRINGHRFDLSQYARIRIIGAGKATAQMAAAVESLLAPYPLSGLITVKYGHTAPLKFVEVVEAGHPVPDENGMRGAARIAEIAESAGEKDLVICLLSGGGSALMPLPAPPLTLADKQETIRQLLACGADISEINAIRKHLSAVKGGQLARAVRPAHMITLVLSDVVGDVPEVIASGPTIGDASTFADCLRITEKYYLAATLPDAVIRRIEQGAAGSIPETPSPETLLAGKTAYQIVGSNQEALCAASDRASALGYRTLILSSMIEGDTAEAAGFHAAVAKQIRRTGHPALPPACIISGGETTVAVKGDGLGGRNQEFCLVAATRIAGQEDLVVFSAGTDGTDGPTDAAGAVVDGHTIEKAAAMGLDAHRFLKRNDAYHFFKKTGGLVMTGPTGTNVMDVRIVLVGPGSRNG